MNSTGASFTGSRGVGDGVSVDAGVAEGVGVADALDERSAMADFLWQAPADAISRAITTSRIDDFCIR